MRFHLDLDTGSSADRIRHRHKILLMGSCFTEHIGGRLEQLKFDCHRNPFGIVFNPESMCHALTRLAENKPFTETDLAKGDESWFSLETHTSLNKPDRETLLQTLNALVADWHARLKTADWLMLTFGSAFYYRHREQGRVVANCHKLPAQQFTKQLAEAPALVAAYTRLTQTLRELNPALKLMVTVSPVKHLRDGVVQNNLSKAILTVAAHGIANGLENCHYFPAYELVNEDLRDYRFYEAEMAHPTAQAIGYVWEKFSGSWLHPGDQPLLDRLHALHSAYQHRPLQAGTAALAAFRKAQLQKCLDLQSAFPYLDLREETAHFS